MHNLSIFGTSSDAGKSTLTFVIAKIIQYLGYSVAPFKAQNVSNNSYICDDGIKIIENDFKIPVLGVLPYLPFNLGFAESVSLKNFIETMKENLMCKEL